MSELNKIYDLNNELNESKLQGPQGCNIAIYEELFSSTVIFKEAKVYTELDEALKISNLVLMLSFLEKLCNHNILFSSRDIINIFNSIENNTLEQLEKIYLSKEVLITLQNGKSVYPKTLNQVEYIKSLYNNDIVFAVGPAGTGKTYLAVLFAASLLKKQVIRKIVLVRPVVEAGEKLGYLPGDLKEKIDPYLIPLYDALNECFGKANVEKMIEKGVIEVAPLAYMRGRTLDNAVIILDEAQNSTTMQMKMFLTRLGFNSKMIITGDITQIDLPNKNFSGLNEALKILYNIKGIKIMNLTAVDVMRHPLVYKIINCYDRQGEKNAN